MTSAEDLYDRVRITFGIDISRDCVTCVFFHPLRTYRPCSCLRRIKGGDEPCAARIEGCDCLRQVAKYCEQRETEKERMRRNGSSRE